MAGVLHGRQGSRERLGGRKRGGGMVLRSAEVEREAEQSWASGTSVVAVEVQGTLYDGAAGVSGTAVGKELVGNRNSAGDVVTQEEEFRLQGKALRRSGLGAAGLKRDGMAGENQRGCSWEEAAGEGESSGRGMEAGEKRLLGCPRSPPFVCICNTKNRVISDTWR